MKMNTLESKVLKDIVHEVIGKTASKSLLGNVYAILDQQHPDADAQKEACNKIGKMVSLFVGPEAGQLLEQRFRSKFI